MSGLAWPPQRCLVIAEVAQTHDGSLGLAHAFIDAIADAGADAVKFQTHIAAAESTPQEPFRVRFGSQDATRYEYWQRMEFDREQWRGLAEHAAERGLLFLSSPFSLEAVELLADLDMPLWKVASGEVDNFQLLDAVADTGRPVLLSSGMSAFADLDAAVERVRDRGAPVALFQCSTAYPCPPEQVGLNLLSELRDRYDCPVGLSDHSGTIFPSLAAVTLGASLIEVHVTLSREMFGPDVVASVTSSELATLVQGIRFIERMLENPVDKDRSAESLQEVRTIFGRSVVVRTSLPAGHVLVADDLAAKKPGGGIPAAKLDDVIGRRLVRDLESDTLLSWDDLDPPG